MIMERMMKQASGWELNRPNVAGSHDARKSSMQYVVTDPVTRLSRSCSTDHTGLFCFPALSHRSRVLAVLAIWMQDG